MADSETRRAIPLSLIQRALGALPPEAQAQFQQALAQASQPADEIHLDFGALRDLVRLKTWWNPSASPARVARRGVGGRDFTPAEKQAIEQEINPALKSRKQARIATDPLHLRGQLPPEGLLDELSRG